MHRIHRITSIVILLCFLLNTTTYDFTTSQSHNRTDTFNLATASIINKLAGIEHKDIGRIKLALEANLIGVDLAAKVIEDLTVPENTVFSPADMHFFFSEMKSLPEGRLAIMCRIKEDGDRRTYYAVFSPEKDEDKGFPIEVYTKSEWEKLEEALEFTGIVPEREQQQPEDAIAIDRYIEHEKEIDAFLAKKIQSGDSFTCSGNMVTALMESFEERLRRIGFKNNGTIIEAIRKSTVKAIKKKNIVFIHENEDKLPEIHIPDPMGDPQKIKVFSHASNNAVYITLTDKEWAQFQSAKEGIESYGQDLADEDGRSDGMPLYKVSATSFMPKFEKRILHEMGVIWGLRCWAEAKNGGYVARNGLDKLAEVAESQEEQQRYKDRMSSADPDQEGEFRIEMTPAEKLLSALVKQIQQNGGIINLDRNLEIRDYAAGEFSGANIEEIATPGKASRDIQAMEDFDQVFKGAKNKEESWNTYDKVVKTIERISAEIEDRHKEEAIKTAKIGVVPGGKPGDTLVVTIKGNERIIGVYDSFLHGVSHLVGLMSEDWHVQLQQNILDALIEGAVSHEIGHGFEGYSGIDLHALFTDKEARDSIADELLLEQEEGQSDTEFASIVAETLADMCIGGPGNVDYVSNKAAYLFYRLLSFSPAGYVDGNGNMQSDDIRDLVRKYYELNPHFEMWSGGEVDNVTDRVVEYFNGFFGPGTPWHDKEYMYSREEAPAEPKAEEAEAKRKEREAREAEIQELVKASYAGQESSSSHSRKREAARQELAKYGQEALVAIDKEIKKFAPRSMESRLLKTSRAIIMAAIRRRGGISAQQGTGERLPVSKETQRIIEAIETVDDLGLLEFIKGIGQGSGTKYMEETVRDKLRQLFGTHDLSSVERTINGNIDIKRAVDARYATVLNQRWQASEQLEIQEELGRMATFAREVGIEVAPPVQDYTLFTSYDFYKDKDEYESDRRAYGSRFNLERIRTDRADNIVDSVLGVISQKSFAADHVIVQLPMKFADERYQPELQKLMETGVRFMIIDVEGLKEDENRADYRRNIYSMMLLARKIDKDTPKDSKLYRLLGFFIDSLFGDVENKPALIADYMESLIQNKDIVSLVKIILSYKPIERYEMPDYDKVSATLISA